MFTYFKHIMQRWLNSNRSTDSALDHDPKNKLLIDLRQVVKIYETPAGPFTAISGIDLQVRAGEFLAVIGQSGSGKSTLINMITGIDRPTLGEIIIAGTAVHQLNETQIARWRGRHVGVIFQFFQLLPTLSLIENVMLPMQFCGLYSIREWQERAMHLLDLVGIADQAYKLPAMVSGGQQQRAAIARALANEPQILVADEPTGNLDSKTADTIFHLFQDLVEEGKTILMVTHNQELASRVTRVVLIADGQIADKSISRALPSLDQKLLVEVSAKLTSMTFAPNSIIFREGDVADHFYIIVKGQVEVVRQHSSGQELILGTLSKGQSFGEMGLLEHAKRNATIRATSSNEVIVMSLDGEMFKKLITDSEMTHTAIARLVRQRNLTKQILNTLPEGAQKALSGSTRELLTYQPGEILFHKGDPAERFYLIVKGAVEVMRLDEQDIAIRLVSGQYFGEIGLLESDGKRTRTVRAARDIKGELELIAIGRETFEQLTTGNKMRDKMLLTMQQYLAAEVKEFGYL